MADKHLGLDSSGHLSLHSSGHLGLENAVLTYIVDEVMIIDFGYTAVESIVQATIPFTDFTTQQGDAYDTWIAALEAYTPNTSAFVGTASNSLFGESSTDYAIAYWSLAQYVFREKTYSATTALARNIFAVVYEIRTSDNNPITGTAVLPKIAVRLAAGASGKIRIGTGTTIPTSNDVNRWDASLVNAAISAPTDYTALTVNKFFWVIAEHTAWNTLSWTSPAWPTAYGTNDSYFPDRSPFRLRGRVYAQLP